MSTRARRLVAATASAVLIALSVAACSSGGSDDSAGSTDSSAASGEASRPQAAGGGGAAADRAGGDAALDSTAARQVAAPEGAAPDVPRPDPTTARSLIKKGNVALRADDVKGALFEVEKVLQRTDGEIAENDTQADDEGEEERALLTVRVPVEQFQTAFDAFEDLGTEQDGIDLIDSSSSSTDVSDEVIDTDVRVQLQRRSIERISVLLDRATSIRDIVGIERELARREADLGSLQKRQAFLADQTSLSTITLSIERPGKPAQQTTEEDDAGFLAGLAGGWDAFRSATTGLLTAVGALLPFALLALVVALPVRAWLRRRPSRPSHPAPSA